MFTVEDLERAEAHVEKDQQNDNIINSFEEINLVDPFPIGAKTPHATAKKKHKI